jgi:hypothetical protein
MTTDAAFQAKELAWLVGGKVGPAPRLAGCRGQRPRLARRDRLHQSHEPNVRWTMADRMTFHAALRTLVTEQLHDKQGVSTKVIETGFDKWHGTGRF